MLPLSTVALRPTSSRRVPFVFANSRALTFRVVTSLEEKIDKAESIAIDVLCNTHVATPKKKISKEEMEDEREFKLSGADQQELVKNQLKDAVEVWNIFNINKGCQHQCLEQYLAHGVLRDDLVDASVHCGSCSVCTKRWFHFFFLPI